ncbi:YqgE/AlgH family protein [Sphingobacterium paludis]|uniref:Putative transcriptional regulator n=1 Tax=Sphingobacterium paludis TaxID=1476465 RepID=A0A4R7CWV3_9SPHI|nr:YqgE/AlgH family protein [Sphingobacterium paludis]TDS12151.1 putative transcriptional regulator [Sphingobacterium paludis]
MFNTHIPQKGSLLLSEPFMLDTNFERSVILLCDHDDQNGTMGLVLNNKSSLLLSDVIQEVENPNFPLYVGGPVNMEALFFIHNIPEKIEGGLPLFDDIYFGGDFEQALFLLNDSIIDTTNIKFFIGYAGWNVGQLNEEILQNNWAVHNKFPTALLLLQDGEDLWKQALINLGPKYAHVANFPKTPDLN